MGEPAIPTPADRLRAGQIASLVLDAIRDDEPIPALIGNDAWLVCASLVVAEERILEHVQAISELEGRLSVNAAGASEAPSISFDEADRLLASRTIADARARIAELEARVTALQADSNRALELHRAQAGAIPQEVATWIAGRGEILGELAALRKRVAELEGVPVGRVGSGTFGGAVRRSPAANEVLPPDQRASWARSRTEYDE